MTESASVENEHNEVVVESGSVPPPPPPPTNPNKRVRISSCSDQPQNKKLTEEEELQQKELRKYSEMARSGKKSKSGFVGLSNQGATCYLNSLIQTLYMTPEIRKMLYEWRFDESKFKKLELCIPLHLQRLFARLQLSEAKAVPTKDLTKSFGWNDRESFVQHDVQELCRKLFEALDKTLQPDLYKKKTDQNKVNIETSKDLTKDALVSELYTGVVVNYLKAIGMKRDDNTEVGRIKEENFMDVQLVIRDVDSIEKALDDFIKPETMDGDNQWFCEELNKKVDATKGFQFKTIPYLLTLHLKRFDYDYTTWQRIKLSNKVSFPFELDASKYLENESNPVVYELFSVLIHSGNAHGGHYYAYIKNVDSKKWYEFNDTSIKEITEDQVKVMYGGSDGEAGKSKYKNAQASTNAYMLMYRKIDAEKNVKLESDESIPEELRKEIEKENEVVTEYQKKHEIQMNNVVIKVEYKDSPSLTVKISKKDSYKELKLKVIEQFKKRETWGNHSGENIRFREFKMNGEKGKLILSEELDEDTPLEKIGFHSFKSIFLETKEDGENWPDEVVTIQLFVSFLNPETKEFTDPQSLRVDQEATVTELKKFLIEKITKGKYNPEKVHMVRFEITSMYPIENADDKKIGKDLEFKDTSLLYFEIREDNEKSICLEKLDAEMNSLTIYFNDPKVPNQFNKSVLCIKSKTLNDLREIIAKELKMNPEKCRLCDKRTKKPFKNLNTKLDDHADFFDYCQVFVEEGKLLGETEYLIKLFSYSTEDENKEEKKAENNSKDSKDSNENKNKTETEKSSLKRKRNSVEINGTKSTPLQLSFKKRKEFKLIGKTVVEKNNPLSIVTEKVAKRLKHDPENIRIRVKDGFKLGRILVDHSESMIDLIPSLNDQTQLVLEFIDEPDNLKRGDVLYYAQRWNPSQWKFNPKVKIVFSRGEKYEDAISSEEMKQILLKQIPDADLNEENLKWTAAPKGFRFWENKESAEVSILDWDINSKNIFTTPLNLKSDELLFYKDANEEEKMDIEEFKKLSKEESSNNRTSSNPSETSLKIYTEFD